MTLTNRQQEIIDAALNLTSQGGIQNLTVKNLAEALGFSEPAIYRHFLNKSEIIRTMIANFESDADSVMVHSDKQGLSGIEAFVKSRFALVAAKPALAKVMFAEELFMDDADSSAKLLQMMRHHKNALGIQFQNAQKNGEIRKDLELDILFRLVFGPVRLLIKQWGMSGYSFDLIEDGNRLWDALCKVLKD